ncbi:MAG: DNA-formamidopyrimidine glycosylase [Candidatus Zambryskibacteria bacterium RIFCSPLOWO2_02_FULL_44_12b]|uniref:DNA-formamidopyrimidine glycosylase n=1 Tax=Candidatus Zambryskibacteria bacterium RIFCSPLOWO2_02_FULL_44_12b TaxID=1802772 RepID=A0A1G2UMD5_9BACT|nr:MAG: DNA-formamidopyrimidine glycosylase [Candidatus Zambryskibacteria bacterium RIFCSPLOWO2_02_FULL_44_12b]
MPELPEVQTTVNGLNRTVRGRKIVNIETTYNSPFYKGKEDIKNPEFFKKFKRKIIGQKILKAERRAKNILIHLSGGETILVHMKMTGHFVYNRPDYPFTRLDFKLDNGKHLVLSDMRKFAKVTLLNPDHLKDLGPEPLSKNFQFKVFNFQLQKRPKGKIKQVLMDQSLISGIGNIYSDEILWRAGVHPLSHPNKIPEKNLRTMFKATKETLKKGIGFGGDSMSDYRNVKGEKGKFQDHHRAYQKHKTRCLKKGCSGVLKKIRIGGRSAHFCPKHQKLFT